MVRSSSQVFGVFVYYDKKESVMKKIAAACMIISGVSAYTPTNIPAVYDFSGSEHAWSPRHSFSCGMRGQYFAETRAYNADEVRVAAPLIYGAHESALGMLEGHRPGTSLHGFANKLRGMQDGERGTFSVTGDFEWSAAIFDVIYRLPMPSFPGMLSFGFHLPFISAGFSDIAWVSNTQNLTVQDDAVHTLFVHDQESLATFAAKHGSLSLAPTRKTGFGDIAAMIYWQAYFSQHQRRLREVLVQLRAGVQVPTGKKEDLDQAFDVDFGHDGTIALPVGGLLRLDLSGGVRVGMDVGLTTLVRRTKEWRLKTGWGQTPHLLLSKGLATREYGPEWRITMFGQLYSQVTGIVLTGGYQFFKHTDSTLYPQDDVTSARLINSSPTVDVSESHNMFAAVSYTPPITRRKAAMPELTAHVLIPFNGKSVVSGYVVSAGISIKF